MRWHHLWILHSPLSLLLSLYGLVGAFQITGNSGAVDSATGARPFRQEINQFAASGAAFDLFILALQQLQQTDQSQPLSYFQISGP